MKRTIKKEPLSAQMKAHSKKKVEQKKQYDGNTETMISTGSTLLDLAISGGRKRGGGIPGGIFVEVFGPSSSGKTVLLCEIAGAVQRQGGEIQFNDPEGRLDKQFARIFDLDTDNMDYSKPDKVPSIFSSIKDWEPKNTKVVNGSFSDSLAALSTDLEMDNEEGDKMGMKRAKEFSEGFRKICRIISNNNYLMVASNQLRETMNSFGPKFKSPGGEGIGFYASLRLQAENAQKIWDSVKFKGKEVKRAIGVKTEFNVFKSSVWKPYRKATLYILFDYGIDDVRANLQFIKDYTSNKIYSVGDSLLKASMNESIAIVEEAGLEEELKEQVIDLWEEIESKFETERKPKQR